MSLESSIKSDFLGRHLLAGRVNLCIEVHDHANDTLYHLRVLG